MSELPEQRRSPSSVDSSIGSPGVAYSTDGNSHSALSNDGDSHTLTKVQSAPAKSSIPPSKTDKPRPHVCGTCQRSFARLEHLKRHERSHTKEKPFECPDCTRCFARRDLLLRHQQKLHNTAAPSANGKGRRDSISSSGVNPSAKIRKNSTTTQSTNGRPRANTISHVDRSSLGMLINAKTAPQNQQGGKRVDYSQFVDMGRGQGSFHSRSISHAGPTTSNFYGLPRLATSGLRDEIGEPGLRTAPPLGGMNGVFGYSPASLGDSTINPAQLHVADDMDTGPFGTMDTTMIEDDDNLDWMRGFNPQMNFESHGDQAPESSSSAMNQAMADHYFNNADAMNWQAGLAQHDSMPGRFGGMENTISIPQDTGLGLESLSPHGYQANSSPEAIYPTPPHLSSLSPQSAVNGFSQQPNHMMYGSDGTSVSSISLNGSAHSSNTSYSTDSITEVTRQALLLSLSQPSSYGTRKYSAPVVSSPLRDATKATVPTANLPSTADLQRFVGAYINYFHPHMPFLHIPTLSFDTPAYTSNLRPAVSPGSSQTYHPQANSIIGGGGCLVLAMAAIGALYEKDRPAAKELFDASKKMIQLYLEERRKADTVSKAHSNGTGAQNTPLWLVQAMLLNVIYGHNCGDRISGEVASTHCSALVSLARAADLLVPLPENNVGAQAYYNGHRLSPIQENGNDYITFNNPFGSNMPVGDENAQWHRWIVIEERKRTLFAIFHMSSLLVSAYNHAPALMNSEIQLDLPCEEEFWCAETAAIWMSKGGSRGAEQSSIPFSTALGILLNASHGQEEPHRLSQQLPFGSGVALIDLPPSALKPSTFGCLGLINALHNYIWETRQRHSGREWTTQETESMHAHIEPALRAWQAAWAANPTHSLQRPNPYGMGPLSADCIPLLDLAYVRLFVNLGMAKEAFWSRDFDAMSEELARGSEIIQHADNSGNSTSDSTNDVSRNSPAPTNGDSHNHSHGHSQQTNANQSQSSKRERHLRKAAFYAADSLSMSDKLGVTFADFTSRELPLQAGLCTFDCAQILAEWVSTVQERVGRYLGVLGRDNIDYANVPAIMLLEDEDCKLLEKIADILNKIEVKMVHELNNNNNMNSPTAMAAMQSLPSITNNGFGSKILTVTAYMFERAAIWPVTNTMAQCLGVQSVHMQRRAENSTKMPGVGRSN